MALRTTLLSTILLAAGTLSALGLRPPLPALAAGGYGTPYQLPNRFAPSPYHISARIEAQYCGEYALRRIDSRTSITDGTIQITREPSGSLLGLVYFYGHDSHGYQTSWFAVLANFQPLAHGRMAIELFNTAGQDLQDALIVTRKAHGDLAGTLQLDGWRYPISWRKTLIHA